MTSQIASFVPETIQTRKTWTFTVMNDKEKWLKNDNSSIIKTAGTQFSLDWQNSWANLTVDADHFVPNVKNRSSSVVKSQQRMFMNCKNVPVCQVKKKT